MAIAIFTYTNTLQTQEKLARQQQFRQWQTAMVYSFILTKGQQGISYNDIRQYFLTEAIAKTGEPVDKEELKDIVLQAVLLELEARHVIIHRLDGSLFAVFGSHDPFFNERTKFDELHAEIIGHVTQEPGVYTIDTLRPKILKLIKVSDNAYFAFINDLIAQRNLRRDDNGKLSPAK